MTFCGSKPIDRTGRRNLHTIPVDKLPRPKRSLAFQPAAINPAVVTIGDASGKEAIKFKHVDAGI